MIQCLRDNLRWPDAELLLTFTSAFGQTWFISLVAVSIKDEYGLTDGSWGSLYTVATLSASGLMFWRGAMADSVPLSRLAPAAAIGMAWAPLLWILGVALFLLRFCGQGGFSNIAMTPMGRWFEDRRGQAVFITNLGHPAGEIIVPPLMVLLIGTIGWRETWLVVVAMLCLTVAPLLSLLLSEARDPRHLCHADGQTRTVGSPTAAQGRGPALVAARDVARPSDARLHRDRDLLPSRLCRADQGRDPSVDGPPAIRLSAYRQ